MLCSTCQKLCQSINPVQDREFAHHDGLAQLRQSADSGCRLCDMIHSDLELKGAQKVDMPTKVTIQPRGGTGIEVNLRPASPDMAHGGKSVTSYIIFQALRLPERLQPAMLAAEHTPDNNTGSSAAFSLTSAWLSECIQNHTTCLAASPPASPPHLPHRVLDVGSPSGSSPPCLVQTHHLEPAHYLALSHCWGGAPHPLKTTTSTLASHLTCIPLSSMPLTFQHAIQVTRRHHVRYLWIDSLCIIQDSPADWAAEAAKMHSYYTRALFTISAADSQHSHSGLFRDRDRRRNHPCVVPMPTGTQGGDPPPPPPPPSVYAFTNAMSVELGRSSRSPSFRPFPLYQRAWVFQEQVLAPRTLTYARDRVSWRCQEAVFDERMPFVREVGVFVGEAREGNTMRRRGDPRVTEASVAEIQRNWIFPPAGSGWTGEKGRMDVFLKDWGRMVSEYTGRELTFQKDKLEAIRGVADALVKVGGGYFAGVWLRSEHSIVMGLVWSTSPGGGGKERLDVAPSWSWASTKAMVIWPGHWLCGMEEKVVVAEVQTDGPRAGELVLEAKVRAGQVAGVGFVVHDGEGGDATPCHRSIRATVSLEERLVDGTLAWFAEMVAGMSHAQGSRKEVHCLVLVENSDQATYRRVGYAMWKDSDWVHAQCPEAKMKRLRIV